MENQIFRDKGKFDDEEVDKYLMKVLERKKGYLHSRLSAIMEKRSPEQADVIRNQYKVMAEEAAAEAAAKMENEEEF